MKLAQPFFISARLLPAIKIDDATISLECIGVKRDRLAYRWYVDLDNGREWSGCDLGAGARVQGDTDNSELQAMFGTLCAFMGACGEGVKYALSTGRESENVTLFPEGLRDWCADHADELGMMQFELEESGVQYITSEGE